MPKNKPEDIAKRFLNYSFVDVEFEYENLTSVEKTLCTKDEFEDLIKWIEQNESKPEVFVKEKKTTRTVVIVNRAQCKKCLDIIESKHVHDFVSCKCGAIFVDGGKEYIRRGGEKEDIIDLSKTEEVTMTPQEQERYDRYFK